VTSKKTDNLQGTLDLLVLKTLEQGPMHGWGIPRCTAWRATVGLPRHGA